MSGLHQLVPVPDPNTQMYHHKHGKVHDQTLDQKRIFKVVAKPATKTPNHQNPNNIDNHDNLPKHDPQRVGDQEGQAHQQGETFSVFSLAYLSVLGYVGDDTPQNHGAGTHPSDYVAHGKREFVRNYPVHVCRLFRSVLKKKQIHIVCPNSTADRRCLCAFGQLSNVGNVTICAHEYLN